MYICHCLLVYISSFAHSMSTKQIRMRQKSLYSFSSFRSFLPVKSCYRGRTTTQLTPRRWNHIFHKATLRTKQKYAKWHFPPRTIELAQKWFQQYNHSASKSQCFNTCLFLFVYLLNQNNLGGGATATTTTKRSPPVYAKPKLAIVIPLFILSRAYFSAPNHSRTIYSHLHTSLLSFIAWPLPTIQSQLPSPD